MAVIEGHAEHVMDAVAPDLLPSLPKLRASLDRRRKSQSGLSRLLAKLLGLELKLRQYEQGKFFCDAIVDAAGTEALVRVFAGPEALPTLAELTDPAAWLRRVGLPVAPEPLRSALERVEAPLVRHAPQDVGAAVGEAQPRADDQVLDRARGQDLAGAGLVHHPRRRCGRRSPRRRRRAARTRRCAARCAPPAPATATDSTISAAQRTARAGPSNVARKPSPLVLISRPRQWSERGADDPVVVLQPGAPAAVADPRELRGGVDDVGEQHGGQHPVAATAPSGGR